jgi:hypothetical protein
MCEFDMSLSWGEASLSDPRGGITQRAMHGLVCAQRTDSAYPRDCVGSGADRDGERRIVHSQVHAFSSQADGYLCGDLVHMTGAGASFHQ